MNQTCPQICSDKSEVKLGRIVWEQIVCESELLWDEFSEGTIYPDSRYYLHESTVHPSSVISVLSTFSSSSSVSAVERNQKKEICDYFDPKDKSGDD